MNPLHLSGYGVELQANNYRTSKELLISDGRQSNTAGQRYLFKPRQCPYDSIIIHAKTGHISLGALRWLSHHNIPIFFLDFTGNTISSILPPIPIKADLRVAQIQTISNPKKKLTIAKSFAEAKITRTLQVMTWLSQKYDVKNEVRAAKHQAIKLAKVSSIPELRSLEGKVALRYWQVFKKALPKSLGFEGRKTTSRNNYATDPFNAALNYSYGFLKVECRMAINTVGLEPAVGFLHETSQYQTSESLVYDLEEPFRWLCDLSVIQAFTLGALKISDFNYNPHDYDYMTSWAGRMRLLSILRETFNSNVDYNGKSFQWSRVIVEKTNELGRYLRGSKPELDFCEPAPILER